MARSGSGGGGGSSGAVRAGRAFVELAAKDVGLAAGLARAKSLVAGIGSALKSAAVIGTGATAAIGVGLSALGKSAGERAVDFQRFSDRIGVPVDQLSAFAYAAEQTGQSVGDLEGHFENFAERVFQAAQGTGEAADTFRRLNLNAAELIKLNPVEQIQAVADAMASITNDTQRRGILSALGSDQFQKLNELLKLGGDGIRNLMEQARADGSVLDPAETRDAAKAMTELNRAWTVGKNAALSLGMAILPSAENARKFTLIFREAVVQTKEWTASTWEAVKAATQLDSAAGGIEGHFATIGEGIGRALEKGDAKGAIKIFTTSIELQFRILVADIADLWNGFAGRFVDTFKDAATAVRLELIDLAAEAQKKLTTTSTGQQITAFSGEAVKRFGAGLIRGGQFIGLDLAVEAGKDVFTKGQAAVNSTVLGQELGPDAARAALENERKAAQERAIRERADQRERDQAAREEFRRNALADLDRLRREHIQNILDANRAAEIAPTPRQVLSNVAPQIAALATSARGQFGGALASASLGGGSVPEQILRENKKGNDLQKEGNTKLEAVRDEIERLRNQSFPAFTVTG